MCVSLPDTWFKIRQYQAGFEKGGKRTQKP
jgi:hypothetical protein